MDNHSIADIFDQMAELLEFKGENPFRIRAYRNGAKAIRDLDEPVAAILSDASRKLANVPGIGKTLVDKTTVLVESGELPQLKKLLPSTFANHNELLTCKSCLLLHFSPFVLDLLTQGFELLLIGNKRWRQQE